VELQWTAPDFWDLWKAISIGLTGVFGILGLLTSYKDKDTGRITVWGKFNLAGIVLSATMGVLSQLVEAQHKLDSARRAAIDSAASAKLAADTARGANVAATNTEKLIGQLLKVSQGTERSVINSRSAAEAGQRAATATLGVARGTAEAVSTSRAGLVRIERLLSPFADPAIEFYSHDVDARLCSAGSRKIEVSMFISRPLTIKTPATASLADAVAEMIATTDATSTTYHAEGKLDASLSSSGLCQYTLSADLHADGNDLEVLSYLDLPGKSILVDVKGFSIAKADLLFVKLQTRDGQHLYIPLADARSLYGKDLGDADEFGFSYEFPAGRDPRSRTDTKSIF